jgi:uncharacterized protein with PQ loop repeat
MVQSSQHHLTPRKQASKLTFLDHFIYIVAATEPMANIPQIITIYRTHQASGVSIMSWLMYALFAITWLAYGIHIKRKPMIIGSSLIFATDMMVVVGAILFGGKII